MANRVRLLTLGLALAATLTFARADVVETNDGKILEGEIKLINGGIQVRGEGQPVKLKLEDIKTLERRPKAAPKQPGANLRGLMVESFAGNTLQKPSAISFMPGATGYDWGHVPPDPYTPPLYSTRLTGFITIPHRDTYRFQAQGFSRIKIGDREWGKDQAANEKGMPFEAGQRVPVTLEFRKQPNAHARASLLWSSDSRGIESIPADHLSPPDDFVSRLEQFHQQRLADTFGGLKGEYFSDAEMKKREFVRLDGPIAMQWRNPAAVNPAFKERLVVRWTGRLKSPKTMTARFAVTNHARLWIDNTQVINAVPDKSNEKPPRDGKFDLKEGQFYDIRLELQAGAGWGDMRLVSNIEAEWMPVLSPKFLYPPTDMPRAHILFPLNESDVDATDGATIRAVASPGQGRITKVELVGEDGKDVLAEATKAPFELAIRPKLAADMKLFARVTNSAGFVSRSDPVRIVVNGAPGELLGGRWSIGRVGEAAAPTVQEEGTNRLRMTAKGGGFGEKSAAPLVSRLLTGDGEIVARLTELKCDDPEAVVLAGLTLRRGMRADSPHVTLLAAKATGWFIARAFRSGDVGTYVEKPLKLPTWIRVERSGATVTAYSSPDGKDWTAAGSLVLGDDTPLVAGMTAFALNADRNVTAVFEDIAIRATESSELATGPGVQLTSGTIIAGAITVRERDVIVQPKTGQKQTIARDKIARVFYAPAKTSAFANVAPTWRGAVMANDWLEGAISDITADGATVTSILFGPQQVTASGGLVALVLENVTRDPTAIIVRHSGGLSVANEIRIDGDHFVFHDTETGDTTLQLPDLLSIRRPTR